jgi:hypothetical protein
MGVPSFAWVTEMDNSDCAATVGLVEPVIEPELT